MKYFNSYTVISFLTFSLYACEAEEPGPEIAEPQVSKTELLAGVDHKRWKTFARTVTNEACEDLTLRELDNVYAFYVDGGFAFSNGEVTEDECYGDLANLIGDWYFSSAEDSLFIDAYARVNNETDTVYFEDVVKIFSGKLDLETQSFRISSMQDNQLSYMEFKLAE